MEPNKRIVDSTDNCRPFSFTDSFLYFSLHVAWYGSFPISFTEMRMQDIVRDPTELYLNFVDRKARLIARHWSARVIDVSLADCRQDFTPNQFSSLLEEQIIVVIPYR